MVVRFESFLEQVIERGEYRDRHGADRRRRRPARPRPLRQAAHRPPGQHRVATPTATTHAVRPTRPTGRTIAQPSAPRPTVTTLP